MTRFALEREHHIDEVLEELGAGDVALLGDVADEDDRDRSGLGQVLEAGGDLANLAHRTGDGVEIVAGLGLNRVDDDELGGALLELGHHRVARGLGQQQELGLETADAARPQRDLFRGLLAGDIDDRPPIGGRRRRDLEQQGRFADPGFAGQQHQGARHQTAAEDAVDPVEPG